MTTISAFNAPDHGLPAPIVELTMEQQFKMKQIENALRDKKSQKEDIITIFLALQHQNFALSNSLTNLVKKWPTPARTVPPTWAVLLSTSAGLGVRVLMARA